MNAEVTATGMYVQAQADSSLLIGNTKATVNASSYDFKEDATTNNKLKPTLYTGANTDNKYGENLANTFVVPGTDAISNKGWLESNGTYEAAAVVDGPFWKDYVVYIATAGTAMDSATLQAQITFDGYDAATWQTNKATAVAFKLVKATEDLGEYNKPDIEMDVWKIAGVDAAQTTAGSNVAGVVNYFNLSEDIAIPAATTGEAITVLMRIYFDGEATSGNAGEGYAFVNSDYVDTTGLGISVKFKAAKNP